MAIETWFSCLLSSIVICHEFSICIFWVIPLMMAQLLPSAINAGSREARRRDTSHNRAFPSRNCPDYEHVFEVPFHPLHRLTIQFTKVAVQLWDFSGKTFDGHNKKFHDPKRRCDRQISNSSLVPESTSTHAFE
jgi:hypothetical protein